MDFQDVENQINDLPTTFKRLGPIFAGLIQSLSAAMARSTRAIDQLASQTNINIAKWGWLDTIGKLYGIPRNPYETDPQYRTRLVGTLTASHGTPQSIVNFIQLALNLNATVTEDFATVSYQINFTKPPTATTLQQVALAINWVRPAGVPFLPLFQLKGGLYLNTLNYLGGANSFTPPALVTGSYLSRPQVDIEVNISANTNNPKGLLPTTYISDPYITGVATVNYPL